MAKPCNWQRHAEPTGNKFLPFLGAAKMLKWCFHKLAHRSDDEVPSALPQLSSFSNHTGEGKVIMTINKFCCINVLLLRRNKPKVHPQQHRCFEKNFQKMLLWFLGCPIARGQALRGALMGTLHSESDWEPGGNLHRESLSGSLLTTLSAILSGTQTVRNLVANLSLATLSKTPSGTHVGNAIDLLGTLYQEPKWEAVGNPIKNSVGNPVGNAVGNRGESSGRLPQPAPKPLLWLKTPSFQLLGTEKVFKIMSMSLSLSMATELLCNIL